MPDLITIIDWIGEERTLALGGLLIGALFGMAMGRWRSDFITAPRAEQGRMRGEVYDLMDRIGVVGEATIAMPYVTKAFRATRP